MSSRSMFCDSFVSVFTTIFTLSLCRYYFNSFNSMQNVLRLFCLGIYNNIHFIQTREQFHVVFFSFLLVLTTLYILCKLFKFNETYTHSNALEARAVIFPDFFFGNLFLSRLTLYCRRFSPNRSSNTILLGASKLVSSHGFTFSSLNLICSPTPNI